MRRTLLNNLVVISIISSRGLLKQDAAERKIDDVNQWMVIEVREPFEIRGESSFPKDTKLAINEDEENANTL